MTPQEKATELVKKYKDYSLHHNSLEKCIKNAKQCALIAVEEILKCESTEPSDTDWDECGATAQYYWPQKKVDAETYWQQVKSEIEKL